MALRRGLRYQRAAVDPAGETSARAAIAGAVCGAQRAAFDGADRLQLPVSLVCGLNIDDPVWDVTVFTKNRERLLVGEVAQGQRGGRASGCPRAAL